MIHTRLLATLSLATFGLAYAASAAATTIVDFETLGSTLAADSAYIGADMAGGFSSQGATFSNSYAVDPMFGPFWSGNAYSNRRSFDPADPYANNNDTAVAPGGGVNDSATWGIMFTGAAVITAPNGAFFDSLYVTNTRTTMEVLENGNQFSKAFGGDTGNDPDLFTIQFQDLSPGGSGLVEFVLADYRFTDNSQDYIVDDWQRVDLTPLNRATVIGVQFTSTDAGVFGVNTPTYAGIDDVAFRVAAVPESGAMALLSLGACLCLWRRRGGGKQY